MNSYMLAIIKYLAAAFAYLKKMFVPAQPERQPNFQQPNVAFSIAAVEGFAAGLTATGFASEDTQRAFEIFRKSMQYPIKCPVNKAILKAEHYAKNSKRLRIRMKYTKRLARCRARR